MIDSIMRLFLTAVAACMCWLMLMFSSSVQAALTLEQCNIESLALSDHLEVYTSMNDLDELPRIEQLAESFWQPADPSDLAPGFIRRPVWYRFTLYNQGATDCSLWLDLGTQLITDIQMYTQTESSLWQREYAGVAYPFTHWSIAQRSCSGQVKLATDL